MRRTEEPPSAAFCRRSRKSPGFILLEYVCSLAIAALLAGILCTSLGRTAKAWRTMQEEEQLLEAGLYMQNILEKHIAYNAVSIRLDAEQNISMDTVWGKKQLQFYLNNRGLYLRTTTGNGSGFNPAFIPDYPVTRWQVEKLSDSSLLISFSLKSKSLERDFQQVITCCNGVISDA